MRFTDFFRRSPAPRGIAVQAQGNLRREIDGTVLRRGMWVTVDMATGTVGMGSGQRVGILTNRDHSSNLLQVMLVDPQSGENVLEVLANQGAVRQARFAEIPPGRGVEREAATALGYL